jgi:hypothetical protein
MFRHSEAIHFVPKSLFHNHIGIDIQYLSARSA